MEQQLRIGRSISIMSRQSKRFFDRELAPCQIGCGQNFFLVRVYENQGISMYDLAKPDQFDKGTVTRAVQKLEEQGYIRTAADERDKRVRRLYTTPEAEPIIAKIYEARRKWNEILTEGMPPEEAEKIAYMLEKMALNAMQYMNKEET